MEKAILDSRPHNALPTESGDLHRLLRAATRQDHQIIDRIMSRIELADAAGYAEFLSIHFHSLQLLEPLWREEDRSDLSGMAECLRRDLRVLGVPADGARSADRESDSPACSLGIAYVIRGSRLGSGFLRRKVPAHFAQSYFDFVPLLSWTAFLQELRRFEADSTSSSRSEVVRGARMAFAAFQRQADQVAVPQA
jgi:heme oxygenase